MLLASIMAKTDKKLKAYTGRNVRISDKGFDTIKEFVDDGGLKLGRFIEVAALEKIEAIKKKK